MELDLVNKLQYVLCGESPSGELVTKFNWKTFVSRCHIFLLFISFRFTGDAKYRLQEVIDVAGNCCFFGSITARDASLLLRDEPNGYYLTRFGANSITFGLSVKSGESVLHFRVVLSPKERLYKFDDRSFQSFSELIEYYSDCEFHLASGYDRTFFENESFLSTPLNRQKITKERNAFPLLGLSDDGNHSHYKINLIEFIDIKSISPREEWKLIGTGGFCEVYKATYHSVPVAIKLFKQEGESTFKSEVRVMR